MSVAAGVDGRTPPPGETKLQEWFVAGCDRRYMKLLAQYILSKGKPGAFFIREKRDHPGCFALSAKESDKHMLTFLIARANNPTMLWTKRSMSGWTLRGCKGVFTTITEMIEHFAAANRPEVGIQLQISRIPSFERLRRAKLKKNKRTSAETIGASTVEVQDEPEVSSPFIKFAAPSREVTRAQHVRLSYAAEDSVVDDPEFSQIEAEMASTPLAPQYAQPSSKEVPSMHGTKHASSSTPMYGRASSRSSSSSSVDYSAASPGEHNKLNRGGGAPGEYNTLNRGGGFGRGRQFDRQLSGRSTYSLASSGDDSVDYSVASDTVPRAPAPEYGEAKLYPNKVGQARLPGQPAAPAYGEVKLYPNTPGDQYATAAPGYRDAGPEYATASNEGLPGSGDPVYATAAGGYLSGNSAQTVEYAMASDGPAAGRNLYARAGPGGGNGTGGPAVYNTASAGVPSMHGTKHASVAGSSLVVGGCPAAADPNRPAAGAVEDVATLNRQMDDLGFDFSDDEMSDDSDLEC